MCCLNSCVILIDKWKLKIFDPIASVNVVADTDNGCHPTGATSTSENDLKRNENLSLDLE